MNHQHKARTDAIAQKCLLAQTRDFQKNMKNRLTMRAQNDQFTKTQSAVVKDSKFYC